ncbi:MAG: B12-binding domain-containing radical SAM protein [Candidatus Methanomethylicota archaeon]|uniref:B12-binding domain-containing radical SAM protein n=1 Tax=Thermoproteota archaeon TaxID=2056631 RepID=A0A497F3H4_9CREN|nr:MAG: B12-binding domain-containing radical SAM protein [Candidatus Verstraetearchaeota archaeon]RLE53488.1 MAG: B12-binding domain-containing radical SAM protein [Candidatus Verstraetearchaeota archaeon]
MKVLLVNPPTTADIETARVIGLKAPPLGLAYLAAVLEKNGYDVKILDAPVLDYTFEDVKREVRSYDPDVVGVTSTTPTIYDAIRTVNAAKEAKPEVFTIIGGPHPTFMPEETLSMSPKLDAVAIGEGEMTLLELVKSLENNQPIEDVKGLAFRKGDEIRFTPKRPFIEDLDSLPFPARHLLPMERYMVFGKQTLLANIMSSRGCPYNCIFCSSSLMFGKKFRGRSPGNVVDEIEELVDKYKVKHIEFADDNFTFDQKRAINIAKEILRRGLNIAFACGARVDNLSRELLYWLKKAGCNMIYVGIESGVQRVLNALRKGIKIEQIVKAVKMIKEVGIEVTGSFVIGAPGETREDVKQTIKFAKKLDLDFAQFTVITPYPGTYIYEYAKREGLLLTNDWSKYTTVKPVMRTKELSAEELERLVAEAYRSFYLRLGFIYKQIRKGRLPLIMLVLKNYLIPSKRAKKI